MGRKRWRVTSSNWDGRASQRRGSRRDQSPRERTERCLHRERTDGPQSAKLLATGRTKSAARSHRALFVLLHRVVGGGGDLRAVDRTRRSPSPILEWTLVRRCAGVSERTLLAGHGREWSRRPV